MIAVITLIAMTVAHTIPENITHTTDREQLNFELVSNRSFIDSDEHFGAYVTHKPKKYGPPAIEKVRFSEQANTSADPVFLSKIMNQYYPDNNGPNDFTEGYIFNSDEKEDLGITPKLYWRCNCSNTESVETTETPYKQGKTILKIPTEEVPKLCECDQHSSEFEIDINSTTVSPYDPYEK